MSVSRRLTARAREFIAFVLIDFIESLFPLTNKFLKFERLILILSRLDVLTQINCLGWSIHLE